MLKENKFIVLKEKGRSGRISTFLVEDNVTGERAYLKTFNGDEAAAFGYITDMNCVKDAAISGILCHLEAGIMEEECGYYILFPEVGGPTLEEYMDMCAPLTEEEAIRIAGELRCALEGLHEQGYLHLFVCARNVFYSPGKPVMMKDPALTANVYGILTEEIEQLEYTGMSPELMDGSEASEKDDLYALGMLMKIMADKVEWTSDMGRYDFLRMADEMTGDAGAQTEASGFSPTEEAGEPGFGEAPYCGCLDDDIAYTGFLEAGTEWGSHGSVGALSLQEALPELSEDITEASELRTDAPVFSSKAQARGAGTHPEVAEGIAGVPFDKCSRRTDERAGEADDAAKGPKVAKETRRTVSPSGLSAGTEGDCGWRAAPLKILAHQGRRSHEDVSRELGHGSRKQRKLALLGVMAAAILIPAAMAASFMGETGSKRADGAGIINNVGRVEGENEMPAMEQAGRATTPTAVSLEELMAGDMPKDMTSSTTGESAPADEDPSLSISSISSGDREEKGGVVVATNQAPRATFAILPAQGPTPLQVCLDATASTDPDGHIVAYAWSCGGSGPRVIRVFESPVVPARITVTLTVTDDRGASSSTTRQITLY